jgi:hypothetical protein
VVELRSGPRPKGTEGSKGRIGRLWAGAEPLSCWAALRPISSLINRVTQLCSMLVAGDSGHVASLQSLLLLWPPVL